MKAHAYLRVEEPFLLDTKKDGILRQEALELQLHVCDKIILMPGGDGPRVDSVPPQGCPILGYIHEVATTIFNRSEMDQEISKLGRLELIESFNKCGEPALLSNLFRLGGL